MTRSRQLHFLALHPLHDRRKDGQEKSSGLARTSLGARHQVAVLEEDGDGAFLLTTIKSVIVAASFHEPSHHHAKIKKSIIISVLSNQPG